MDTWQLFLVFSDLHSIYLNQSSISSSINPQPMSSTIVSNQSKLLSITTNPLSKYYRMTLECLLYGYYFVFSFFKTIARARGVDELTSSSGSGVVQLIFCSTIIMVGVLFRLLLMQVLGSKTNWEGCILRHRCLNGLILLFS